MGKPRKETIHRPVIRGHEVEVVAGAEVVVE
jgi:hypothetical protein